MNTHVDFKIAELLKDKGWNINTYSNCWVKTLDGKIIHNKDRENIQEHDRCEQYLMQPTISEVVMWLSEQHIDLCHIVNYENGIRKYRMGIIYIKDNKIESVFIRPENNRINFVEFNSITEAYTAAIEYCLTKLL